MDIKLLTLFIFLSVGIALHGQNSANYSSSPGCNIKIAKKPLGKKKIAVTDTQLQAIYEKVNEYVALHFFRRRKDIYLHAKVLNDEACIRSDNSVELYFQDETYVILDNDIDINCNGYYVHKLHPETVNKLISRSIEDIKIYTEEEDILLKIGGEAREKIQHDLSCLKKMKNPR